MAAKKGSLSITKKQKLNSKGDYKKSNNIEEEEQLSSEEENLDNLSDDEIDGNDEVNLEDASLSDEEEKEEEEDDDDIPTSKTNKPKKNKNDDGSESFSTAVSALLNSHLKAHDRDDPILVRQKKKLLKQKEDEKLELKARRLINAEKKLRNEKSRVKDLLPSADATNARELLEYERKLKKTAQRGVIKLFNAVLSTQIKTTNELKDEKLLGNKQETAATELSKEKFLDLVKAAK